MGFFKNIFKPKPGGSFVGNLFRKAVPFLPPPKIPYGGAPSSSSSTHVRTKSLPSVKTPANKEMSFNDKLKKYWYWVALGVLGVIGGIYFLTRPKQKGFKKRR